MKYYLVCLMIFISFPALAKAEDALSALEKTFDGKIGIYAVNTNNNDIIAYRADEHFPVQSTMKLISVADLLQQSESDKSLLQKNIHYTKNDLMTWHPITGKYIKTGMTLKALAEAAITYSDNPAVNLIIKKLGGPGAITHFAHAIGNQSFNVTHYDGNLNSNPSDAEDSATPKDMALSVKSILLGKVLNSNNRALLLTWMQNDTVAYKRIRAGVPIGWTVADKTGSGDYGIANDIGLMWSPLCKPIVLAIYTAQSKPDAKIREDIVASATSIVLGEFAKKDACFKRLAS